MAKSIDTLYEEADHHYYDGALDKAADLYKQILKREPRHQAALHSMGIIHYDQDDYRPAIDYMLQALVEDPSDTYVHSNLGKSLYGLHHMGEKQRAAEIAQHWMKQFPDNEIAQHMGAAVTGLSTPGRASNAYVTQTFDEFADTFDDKLEELRYQAPALIAAALTEYLPKGTPGLRIMDAGCGTGLCAEHLQPIARRIDGIDLSAEMLAKARERNAYARLDQGDLGALLSKRAGRYDCVVAADVLCYFGDLEAILDSFYRCLRQPGWLAFSLETGKTPRKSEGAKKPQRRIPNFKLEISGRYVHSRHYIEQAVSDAGFTLMSLQSKTLRTEYGKPVKGVVVIAVNGDEDEA